MHEVTGRPVPPAVRRDRGHDSGVLIPALLVSGFIHAAIFLGLGFEVHLEPRAPTAPISEIIQVVPAMQAYDIVEVAGDAAPIEVQIVEQAAMRPPVQRPVQRSAGADVPAAGDEPAPERVDPRPVRERLRYQLSTPQVWQPPTEEVALEPTDHEIVEQRIAATLGAFNDSVAAEAAAAARALDWTAKDADGGRWGVSPEGIHLGSITIPLGNSQFAVAPGRREEFAGRVRTWNELQDQAVREEAKTEFKDRVKAIEERMNKERAARRAPPVTPPPASGDTTRSGGRS